MTGGTPVSPIFPIVNNIVLNGGTLNTGATFALQTNRGIGLEFARQYSADGWDVIAAARHSSAELP